MNEQAILHMPSSKYCFATSNKSVCLRLRVAKGEQIKTINVIYGNKYVYGLEQNTARMQLSYADRLFDYYTANIFLDDVRFVYVFEILTNDNMYYYSEDGLSLSYDYKLAYYNAFQLPYINQIDLHNEVEWTKTAVFYQIFVDRFCIGDDTKDKSYINLEWGEIPNPKSYAGGDIRGIINKIDYIKSLGVNTIYLTPVFQADSNHKYNISDYKKIDEHFGNDDDLKELVKIAHGKNMKIVLDAVFNHCSDTMKEFIDVKEKGKKSKYFDWFMISGDKIDEQNCNYETFASCHYMPKLNTSNLEVQDFLLDIAMYYLDKYNIDGWRLDVSDEVSHNFWKKLRQKIKSRHPDCAIIGENWHDAYPFLQGDEYDSIMNYAFTKACLDMFAFDKYNAQQFCDKLNELLMRNTDIVNGMMLNLLDSHDTFRYFTEIKESVSKLICSLAIMYFYPGIPMIYYGTENNMIGGFDPDCRRTFDWGLEQVDNDTKVYIKLLSNIKQSGLLKSNNAEIQCENGTLTIKREIEKNKNIVLVVNLDNDNTMYNHGNRQPLLEYNTKDHNLNKYGFLVLLKVKKDGEV